MFRMVLWVILGVMAGMLFQKYIDFGHIIHLWSGICGLGIALINVVVMTKTDKIGVL